MVADLTEVGESRYSEVFFLFLFLKQSDYIAQAGVRQPKLLVHNVMLTFNSV